MVGIVNHVFCLIDNKNTDEINPDGSRTIRGWQSVYEATLLTLVPVT